MDTKFWLNSLTVRGALLSALPIILSILKLFGVEIAEGEAETVVDGLAGLAGAIGVVLTIVGRLRAKEKLTLNK